MTAVQIELDGTDLIFRSKYNPAGLEALKSEIPFSYRMWDKANQTLVYLAISRKLIEGAPANSLSTVPVMPWGIRP